MGLKIMKERDGGLRRIWYGRLTRNGRKVDVRLDAGPIAGEIPVTEAGSWDKAAHGDKLFEASRREAERAFERLVRGDGKRRDELAEIESRRRALTGRGFERTPLASLFGKWLGQFGDNPPTIFRQRFARMSFTAFAAFAATYSRKGGATCSALEDVTPDMALAFYLKLKGAFAWETVKARYSLLKGAWSKWAHASGEPNPFESVTLRRDREAGSERVSRKPLTADEARRLFAIVRERDPKLFPLVACAATTGLRLGDAVSLTWSQVKLERDARSWKAGRYGTIGLAEGLETSKTGARVVVPIIQPFADVLREMDLKRDDRDVHLFPAHLERYRSKGTRDGLIREVKPFFALATMKPGEADAAPQEPKPLAEVLKLIDGANFTPDRKRRLRAVITERLAGVAPSRIADDLNVPLPYVSLDLRDLENLTGDTYRTQAARRSPGGDPMSRHSLIMATRKVRKTGKKAASLYGWHSFRATYVVLALEAGVPPAYVMKAVGHTTFKMTLQYFNPTGRHAAAVMGRALAHAYNEELELKGEPIDVEAIDTAPTSPQAIAKSVEAMTDAEKLALASQLLASVKGVKA